MLVMRADNDGEGGIMALITLLRHGSATRGRRAAMFLAAWSVRRRAVLRRQHDHAGDLVLSAVEASRSSTRLRRFVVPITAVIMSRCFPSSGRAPGRRTVSSGR